MSYRLYPTRCLMPAVVFCAVAGGSAHAQAYDVAANGLPILNSSPGALSIAYMDFDGGNALGGTYRGPYGGDLVFNTTEQNQIYNAWLDVSTMLSMFDINVTTVAPNKSINPTSHLIISDDVSGGAANVNQHGSTSSSARGQNQSSDARNRTTGIAHEFGHILGLNHQSEYDSNGTLIKQYRNVDQWNRAPLMGVDYAGGLYAHWADGPTSAGSSTYQHDAAKIAATIVRENKEFSNNAYSGDGFRPDEHGNTFVTATPMTFTQTGVSGSNVQVSASGKGIIERYTDIDMFSLDWTGGPFTLTGEAVRSVASAQQYASSVGLNLRVYDAGGVQVAQDLAANPADVKVSLNLDLDPGTYYFGFEGAGGIGDLGSYNVSFAGTTRDPNAPPLYDLVYHEATGAVYLDTKGQNLINYVITGSGFIEEGHVRLFPGPLGSSLDGTLSETDGSLVGVGGLLPIGQVLPAGLDQAGFEAYIASTRYVAGLGQPVEAFVLTYYDGIVGDADGDGDIDDADLAMSFSNYTGPIGAAGGKTFKDGDGDGDGDVDDADLAISFSGYTGPTVPANVPEPASLAVMLAAGVLSLLRRRALPRR